MQHPMLCLVHCPFDAPFNALNPTFVTMHSHAVLQCRNLLATVALVWRQAITQAACITALHLWVTSHWVDHALRCLPFQHMGCAEMVRLASSCSFGRDWQDPPECTRAPSMLTLLLYLSPQPRHAPMVYAACWTRAALHCSCLQC